VNSLPALLAPTLGSDSHFGNGSGVPSGGTAGLRCYPGALGAQGGEPRFSPQFKSLLDPFAPKIAKVLWRTSRRLGCDSRKARMERGCFLFRTSLGDV